ncbi:MFS transporter [Rugosimonospora africana]|nr:MFS transporter [Rugosimonospora africana]
MAGLGGIRGSATHRIYSVTVFVILASLENVAIGLPVPLYDPISRSLGVSKGAVNLVTAASFLVTAVAAVGWAYTGDRSRRKPLLMGGTAIWAVGFGGCGLTHGYLTYFAFQMFASIGLGAVASVGFSVVSDLISPRRRGLVMSLWGLSHGVGTLAGTLVGGVLGAGASPDAWRRPFLLMAGLGLLAVLAYLFVYDIRRGQSEPELAALFEAGGEYRHRIDRSDVAVILRRRTNVWLILQGLTAQATFGSLVWLPQLLQSRAQTQGYPESTAIVVGSVFSVLFQLGGALSIIGGLVGDRLQRRTPRGRALVAAAGIFAGVPFYVVLFFVPLRVHISAGAGKSEIVLAVLRSVVTEPTVAACFLAALTALALTSANSPNWFALLADVNPPEHRGTVYSMGNLVNGVGRAAGNSLVSVMFRVLTRALPPPLNYATGLAVFQVFFIPTGIMYYLASRTVAGDIDAVRGLLRARGRGTGTGTPEEDQPVEATTGS